MGVYTMRIREEFFFILCYVVGISIIVRCNFQYTKLIVSTIIMSALVVLLRDPRTVVRAAVGYT